MPPQCDAVISTLTPGLSSGGDEVALPTVVSPPIRTDPRGGYSLTHKCMQILAGVVTPSSRFGEKCTVLPRRVFLLSVIWLILPIRPFLPESVHKGWME